MWENRFQTATTQFQNWTRSLEVTTNQRRDAQARLEQLQEARRREQAAAQGQGRRRY